MWITSGEKLRIKTDIEHNYVATSFHRIQMFLTMQDVLIIASTALLIEVVPDKGQVSFILRVDGQNYALIVIAWGIDAG